MKEKFMEGETEFLYVVLSKCKTGYSRGCPFSFSISSFKVSTLLLFLKNINSADGIATGYGLDD
jgi:hypothetical protein